MSHYAKIENEIVVQVNVVEDDFFNANRETRYTGTWIQTSYNTRKGIHILGGTPLRKNYAGVGYTYDEQRDAFIPPKINNGWILNEETCDWESSIPYPQDGKTYIWNNEIENWSEL